MNKQKKYLCVGTFFFKLLHLVNLTALNLIYIYSEREREIESIFVTVTVSNYHFVFCFLITLKLHQKKKEEKPKNQKPKNNKKNPTTIKQKSKKRQIQSKKQTHKKSNNKKNKKQTKQNKTQNKPIILFKTSRKISLEFEQYWHLQRIVSFVKWWFTKLNSTFKTIRTPTIWLLYIFRFLEI